MPPLCPALFRPLQVIDEGEIMKQLFAAIFVLVFAAEADASPPKLPVPETAAREKALATIMEVYKTDYQNDKAALAKKLVQKAKDVHDPVEQFVLWEEAAIAFAETFQGQSAFQAIDTLAEKYNVSASIMKAKVVESAAKKVRTSEQKRAVADAALQVVDEAIQEDNFDVAGRW